MNIGLHGGRRIGRVILAKASEWANTLMTNQDVWRQQALNTSKFTPKATKWFCLASQRYRVSRPMWTTKSSHRSFTDSPRPRPAEARLGYLDLCFGRFPWCGGSRRN